MKVKNVPKEPDSPPLLQSRNRTRNSIINRDFDEYLLEYETIGRSGEERTYKQRCCRCCLITSIIIFVLALLIFISIFVVIPVVFMYSVEMQRNLVFERHINSDEREFTNFPKYGIEATRNLYIDFITNGENITLGVWHILPLELVYAAVENENYNYAEALYRSSYPVLLYFHDSDGNRISDINKFRILRRFFHVIAFDYRDYGDSTKADLTEGLVVQDSVQMYRWLDSQTKANIFVWGHSLGASLATSTIIELRKEDIVPMGLFLEAPFTSLREELYCFPLTKFFAWMPWFDATFVDSLEENGFLFKTHENILSIDCPIMVMHARDDLIVPFILSEKLVGIARDMRDEVIQGNVTLRLFPEQFQFGHKNIYQAVELPDYIRNHIRICQEHDDGNG